jgi:hypothetical protein
MLVRDVTPTEENKKAYPAFPPFSFLVVKGGGRKVYCVRHNATGELGKLQPHWLKKYRYLTICRKSLPELLEPKKKKRKVPEYSVHRRNGLKFHVPKKEVFARIVVRNRNERVKIVARCHSNSGNSYTIYEHGMWGWACSCWSYWTDNSTARKGNCKHTLALQELELFL